MLPPGCSERQLCHFLCKVACQDVVFLTVKTRECQRFDKRRRKVKMGLADIFWGGERRKSVLHQQKEIIRRQHGEMGLSSGDSHSTKQVSCRGKKDEDILKHTKLRVFWILPNILP